MPMRSAIVLEPVDLMAAVVPACIAPSSERSSERDSMRPRPVGAADVRALRRGGRRGARGRRGLAGACEGEAFFDPALEDRDAHLHALRDDFLALEASLASQFGGRQMIR